MREQREPWLKLPARKPGNGGIPRIDPRFRTHVVPIRRAGQAPAEPLLSPLPRSSPDTTEPDTKLSGRSEVALPTPAAIERAAAAAAISRRPRSVEAEFPRLPIEPAEARAPTAPVIGLDDLPSVSSGDWAAKVEEAAKIVDVVVVFYSAACLGSEMFELALGTVVNEVLPQQRRPYAVYRFCLDAEPDFVAQMAASLGLAPDNPVTIAGFAWSGPGRRLFLIGDRAFGSPAIFQRSLRRSLMGERADFSGRSAARRQPARSLTRARAVRPWGGRVLALLAWCLFGTAALGAVVVSVAPQWASSLLHDAALPGPTTTPKDSPRSGDSQAGTPTTAASLGNPTSAPPGAVARRTPVSVGSAKRAQAHVRKKHAAGSLRATPTY